MDLHCQMHVTNLYQCDPGFRTEKRIFPYHYLLYVHKGKGWYRIGNHTYTAAAGDLFYCPPNEANTIMASEEDPFLLSGIEFVCNQEQLLEDGLPTAENILSDPFLVSSIREMMMEYRYGRTYSAAIGSHILASLLLRLLREPRSNTSDKRDTVSSLLHYIQNHLDRQVTHAELSREFSYHKNSINHLLKTATGMSLKNYQLALRIKKASVLLAYSDKTIREIAELCGYQSTPFFSKQFKEKTGTTPLQFRKNGKNHLNHLRHQSILEDTPSYAQTNDKHT